jgi:phosphatidylglycerophosphate synthase
MFSIPNLITISRILLVPVFAVLFAVPGAPARIAAFVIFCIAGVSDALDGLAARKLNAGSDFGRMLDPIADKILVAVALMMLVSEGAMILDPLAWRWLPDNVATTYSLVAYVGLWVAAALTVGTGYAYFRGGLRHLHPRARALREQRRARKAAAQRHAGEPA